MLIEIEETPIGDENKILIFHYFNNIIEIEETPIGDENDSETTRSNTPLSL